MERRARRRAARVSSPAVRPRPAQEEPCARQILTSLVRRAYRQPASTGDVNSRDGVLPRRPQGRQLRVRYPARAAAHSRQPEVRAARRARSCGRAGGRRLPHQRRRAGLAPVLLPVEQHSRRRAADAGRAGPAPRVRWCSSSRSGACCATRVPRALVDNFAGQWLQLRNLQRVTPDNDLFPRVRRQPAPELPARGRAAVRDDHARGPQRARSPDRRLHVRRRAAGAALRHPERLRQSVPARAGAPTRRARGCSARARCCP